MTATRIDELDTPSLAVDLDVFEANVRLGMARWQAVAVRPHLKTAKSPLVAKRLLAAGARGICVAKLSEAEVMLAAGICDVMITTELAGPVKARRLAAARKRWAAARLRVVIDSFAGASALDTALGASVQVLIEVNVGQDRCGVAAEEAVDLAGRLAGLEHVELVGVQGYEGNLQHIRDAGERRARCDAAMSRLGTAVAGLRGAGHAVDVVSTGGTGTAEFCAEHEVVTEVQPGSFVFMDADYLDTGAVPYRAALVVLATVISRPTADRAVLDAGLKALSDDSGPARLLDSPGWRYEPAGDEHGVLRATSEHECRDLRVGDRVSLLPSHIDTTVNLHDTLYVHRAGAIEARWPVAARGRVQ